MYDSLLDVLRLPSESTLTHARHEIRSSELYQTISCFHARAGEGKAARAAGFNSSLRLWDCMALENYEPLVSVRCDTRILVHVFFPAVIEQEDHLCY